MISKAVIPAAGFGTRLLPATKEMPKEMLPIFALDGGSKVCVKPLLQLVFEQFYASGIREFCFIVGREKESISNHFTSDLGYLFTLNDGGKRELADELSRFYDKVRSSSIVFISQPEPKGFGDAVLRAEPYIKEPFLVQAGDTLILSKRNSHLQKLFDVHDGFNNAATLFVKEVENPRLYGIVEGEEVDRSIYRVSRVVEKPKVPKSNLAITAIYLFTPAIFKALKLTSIDKGGELQLTDGIQKLIESSLNVMAVKLDKEELWLDIGNPQSYWTALSSSHSYFERSGKSK